MNEWNSQQWPGDVPRFVHQIFKYRRPVSEGSKGRSGPESMLSMDTDFIVEARHAAR